MRKHLNYIIMCIAFLSVLVCTATAQIWQLSTLGQFNGTNGSGPNAVLAYGNDGSFYGTTYSGGCGNYGTVFNLTTNGTLATPILATPMVRIQKG